jgi:ABC-type polysaccharide/polyol phosphate transport system ATPase subunit
VSATEVAAPVEPLLRFEHVGKVFCATQRVARRYAMRDILRRRRNRLSALRPGEWTGLRDISFELRRGETLLVLGLPYSGKSTVADLVSAQRAPEAGRIVRRGSVGLLGGGKYGQNPYMKLREYVRLMAALQGVQAADLPAMCDTILEWTDLTAHQSAFVGDLPRPIVSRLPLVGSMLATHDIYVFDDYSPLGDSDLDRRLAARFEEIVSTSACVMTSAGRAVPARVDQVIVLHGGESIYDGPPEEGLRLFELFSRHVQRSHRPSELRSHFEVVPPVEEARAVLVNIAQGSLQTDSLFDREITLLRGLGQPIILGPCLADPAWEALFWLPFVRWARKRLGDPPPALAISKGEVGPWYAGAAEHFVNVYDIVPPQEFVVRDEERIRQTGTLKQSRISQFESELIQLATARCGLPAVVTPLHPSVLLAMLAKVWRGHTPVPELTSRAVYERLQPLEENVPGLPAHYVVMSLRFTNQFPNTSENLAFASGVMRAVSARIPVIVPGPLQWSSPEELDGGCGIHTIDRAIKPTMRRMLASIVGGADAVIGTLMGPVTLAPFLGIPSLCVHAPAGGFVEFQTATFRHAADERQVPVVTAAVDAISTEDVCRWLDGVLGTRRRVGTGAGPA